MKTAKYLYSLLLKCYPRAYRDAFGAQMLQTFIDQYVDLAMPSGNIPLHFLLFTVIDELKNIISQQMAAFGENTQWRRSGPTIVFSVVLLVPFFAVCYALVVTTALALPHPPISGAGFLIALAMILVLAGSLSIGASYVLANAVAHLLFKRNLHVE